jgi:hypothetical protein
LSVRSGKDVKARAKLKIEQSIIAKVFQDQSPSPGGFVPPRRVGLFQLYVKRDGLDERYLTFTLRESFFGDNFRVEFESRLNSLQFEGN